MALHALAYLDKTGQKTGRGYAAAYFDQAGYYGGEIYEDPETGYPLLAAEVIERLEG
jgi:hypothetical protein